MSEYGGLWGDEKDLAIVVALARVLAFVEFIIFVRTVGAEKRQDFYPAVKNDIALRLKRAEIRSVAEFIPEESFLIARNYSNPELVVGVGNKYSDMGSNQVSKFLDSILAHLGEFETRRKKLISQAHPKKTGDLLIPERRALSSFLKVFLNSQSRNFIKALLRLIVQTKKNNQNDFSW